MAHDLDALRLKRYTHWTLMMHHHQYPYVGRCVAWANRDDAKVPQQMTAEEREELFTTVIPEWSRAVSQLYGNDWENIAAHGNHTPHLHWHLVPRYHRTLERYGMLFEDPKPTKNYSPYEKRPVSGEIMGRIRQDLLTVL